MAKLSETARNPDFRAMLSATLLHPHDATPRFAFADYLRDHGHDAHATVLQAAQSPDASGAYTHPLDPEPRYPTPINTAKNPYAYVGLPGYEGLHLARTTDHTGKAYPHVSFSTHSTVVARAPLTHEQLHDVLRAMPKGKTKAAWVRAAHANGWLGAGRRPMKLARSGNMGDAVAETGSGQAASRVGLVRQVLSEAGLTPATIKTVLTQSGKAGMKAAVMAAIHKSAHPELVRYAAAWYGLMSQESRLTVFHPAPQGPHTLHVITTPAAADVTAGYLSKSGVPHFNIEQRPDGGSRAYVFNPEADLTHVKRGLNARHSVIAGHGYQLGSGPGADAAARASYRATIRAFESAARGTGGPAAEGQAKLARVHPSRVKLSLATMYPTDWNHPAAGPMLADHMADEGDPREELVRHGRQWGDVAAMGRDRVQKFAEASDADRSARDRQAGAKTVRITMGEYHLPEGHGSLTVFGNYAKGAATPQHYNVRWRAGTHQSTGFDKGMMPAEFHAWTSRFDAPHDEGIRKAAEQGGVHHAQ